jgi:protoporphyrinogen oxidase
MKNGSNIFIIMKVVIIGAGIAGLTVAHELVEKGFEVEVYEKGEVAGGMARSDLFFASGLGIFAMSKIGRTFLGFSNE